MMTSYLRIIPPTLATLRGIGGYPASGLAQDSDPVKKRLETSPRHHEWVQVKTRAGRSIRAFVAFPEVSKPVPGVVVIHENRGRSPLLLRLS
ncbi:MAG: hypothetical protein HY718_18745 [Planctomycetes bacterium]|nr:hypothetical protein [Planctomycetota bacterium]